MAKGAPGKSWTHGPDVLGRSEPGSTARVEWEDGAVEQVVPSDGLFRIAPKMTAGDHLITIAVRDAAGNTTSSQRHLRFDDEAPVLAVPTWPDVEKTTDSPVFEGQASDNLKLKIEVTINGETFKSKLTPTGFRIETHGLAQGTQTIDVRASDRAGNSVTFTKQLLIDSTEKLSPKIGQPVLGASARRSVVWTKKIRDPSPDHVGDESVPLPDSAL